MVRHLIYTYICYQLIYVSILTLILFVNSYNQCYGHIRDDIIYILSIDFFLKIKFLIELTQYLASKLFWFGAYLRD